MIKSMLCMFSLLSVTLQKLFKILWKILNNMTDS